jgi:hypothetical protein
MTLVNEREDREESVSVSYNYKYTGLSIMPLPPFHQSLFARFQETVPLVSLALTIFQLANE